MRYLEALPLTLFCLLVALNPTNCQEKDPRLATYLEEFSNNLENQQQSIRFVFDQDFFLRNTNAKKKALTASFNTSLIEVKVTTKVQVAFFRLSSSYKAQLADSGSPVKTLHFDIYDISSKLKVWQQLGNPGKMDIHFNVTRSGQMHAKKFLKKWNKLAGDDSDLRNIGPVILVVYFRDSLAAAKSVINSVPVPDWMRNSQSNKLRAGSPRPACQLHDFAASFSQLGLSNEFIHPRRINFFACYGHCDIQGTSVDSRASHMTAHAWMLEHARNVMPLSQATKNNLQICCVPIRYQGIRVLKRDRNNNIISRLIPDMTASACGCR